ncbi:MAG TPA: hypothetical protein VKB20_11850 [Steroidobacteraceae bacterium]|nr:hypothetical protein [Steroidobacteraceae bacterium]
MGRPRKIRLPGDPPEPEPVLQTEVVEVADEEPEEMLLEELVDFALENRRMKLTPAMVSALNQEYRNNVRADDEYGKRRARECADRLKRATHPELHPGCPRVTTVVPLLKNEKGTWPVKINERVYVGKVEVWECEYREILELIRSHDQVEKERMSDTRAQTELDANVMLAERVAAIQRA